MDTKDDKIVVFGSYSNSTDAYLIKGILSENNIPCFISNEISNILYPIFDSVVGGGITLHVFERDVEEAKKIIEKQQEQTDDTPFDE